MGGSRKCFDDYNFHVYRPHINSATQLRAYGKCFYLRCLGPCVQFLPSSFQTPADIEEQADASEAEDPNGEEEKCCL